MMAALDGHNGIYHAATRTGQLSPILAHIESIRFCGLLWV
jgi:hypothetical protein